MFLISTRVPNGSVPRAAQRDIGLHAHLTPFHVGIGGADGPQEELELLRIAAGLFGGPDDRLGDDLHQRRARAVEVDEADLPAVGVGPVDELGGVLLEMRAGDPDRERPVRGVDGQAAPRCQRQVVLADLVALGQVRVEVVLAVPAGGRRGRRLDRGAGREDMLHGSPIDRRQGARQAEADRADVRVRARRRRRRSSSRRTSSRRCLSWQWTSIPMTAS